MGKRTVRFGISVHPESRFPAHGHTPLPTQTFKTKFLLLVLYAAFVVAALVYLFFARQWQADSRLDPQIVADIRAAADTVTDLETAHRYALGMRSYCSNSGRRITASPVRSPGYYLLFAFIAPLPLAGYAGQTMRSKLFVNRPVEMPRLVYWTLFGVYDSATGATACWRTRVRRVSLSSVRPVSSWQEI